MSVAEGNAYLRRGAMVAAVDAYARGLAATPGDGDGWFNYGWTLRALRRFDEALAAYDMAIAQGMRGAEEAFVNRAAILSDHRHDRDGAIAAFDAALAINPRFAPALVGLGKLAEDAGDLTAAAGAYERMRAIDPCDPRALGGLAAVMVARGDAAAACALVRPALVDTSGPDRATLLFALGAAEDARGDEEAAWSAIAEANAIRAQTQALRYDRDGIDAFVAQSLAAEPMRVDTPPHHSIAFICGMFRSGSTLLEQQLARHPGIVALGERETIPALASQLPGYPGTLAGLTPAMVRDAHREYPQRGSDQGVVIDKRCDNILHLGLAKALFPQARLIVSDRDPRDTALSILFHDFDVGLTYGHRLADIAHYYRAQARLTTHWAARFGTDMIRVSYDALVTDPCATINGVAAALGLAPAPLGESPTDPVRTASALQVRQPVHTRSIGRWRRYQRFLDPDALAALTPQR